jgi:hypothetical protein
MTSATTDRRLGLSGNKAYKTPVTAVATTNVTLSGEQTVGGVAVLASNAAGVADRVLLTGQSTASQNGIWDVSTGSWTRSIDSNGNTDIANGTQVTVTRGTGASQIWILTTADPITIDTTSQTWSQNLSAGFLSTLAGAGGAALVGYQPPGGNSVARTVHGVLRERYRLTDYLSTTEIDDILAGTGSIDVSAKFQIAVTDATGRVLELPEGRIRADGMSIVGSRSCIAGAGGLATRISAPTATTNVFTVSNTFCELRDLYIDSVVTRSGGWYVDIAAAGNRFRLKDFYFDGFLGGIRNAAAASATFEQGYMLNGVATTGVAIRINDGADITIRDIVSDQASQLFAGVYVTKTSDLTIEDCNFIHCGQAVYLNPGAGDSITSVWVRNSFLDTSTRGFYALAAGGTILRCILDTVWMSSHTSEGARLASSGGGSVDGVYFNNCQLFLNGTDGLNVADTGVTNVHVATGSAAQNVGSGYAFAANVSSFSVKNARSGAGDGLTGNNYGIFVAAGTSANYTVSDCTLRSNTTSPLTDGGTGAGKVIVNNPDYDSGSATYDPGSLNDGAGVTTTLSVFGAEVGDMVDVSFSQPLQGITLTGWVSASGTVSVRFQNETTGILDLLSGTLRAFITRRT